MDGFLLLLKNACQEICIRVAQSKMFLKKKKLPLNALNWFLPFTRENNEYDFAYTLGIRHFYRKTNTPVKEYKRET